MSTNQNNVEEVKIVRKSLNEVYDYDLLKEEVGSKSKMIRRLHSEGYSNSEIGKFMKIIYQFVYNVLHNDKMKKELQAYKAK